ncbi:GNAT family N-acetyltransferase [Micromonospora sp. NPDC049049]|uniref:GNAT family N-acetyltransferase n=1 Tax=Micromonospora sp. NPDC049049 TaxID=3155495 RepID=UPI00340AF710
MHGDVLGQLTEIFHPDRGGRGLATEAATALLDWGFTEFGLHWVYGRCHCRNTASARLMERLGMRQEARQVESYLFRGEWGRPARLRDPGTRVAGRDPHAADVIVHHGDVRVGSTPQTWRSSHSR